MDKQVIFNKWEEIKKKYPDNQSTQCTCFYDFLNQTFGVDGWWISDFKTSDMVECDSMSTELIFECKRVK